jgi:hypothetical protein
MDALGEEDTNDMTVFRPSSFPFRRRVEEKELSSVKTVSLSTTASARRTGQAMARRARQPNRVDFPSDSRPID